MFDWVEVTDCVPPALLPPVVKPVPVLPLDPLRVLDTAPLLLWALFKALPELGPELLLPEGPGLGVELDRDAVERYRVC